MAQLIVGNWKMNGLTADARALAEALRDEFARAPVPAELLVCPPATQLTAVAALLAGTAIAVGAQDCHMAPKGAHTGDLSAPMIADAGATYVILGHSERRANHNELDETVREKVVAARDAGLIPIVCVGETADQRSSGNETEIVGWQIKGSLPDGFASGPGLVAYEPVWAVGTGRNATAADIETMHRFVREELVRQFGEAGHNVRILYGGSVNPNNARELLATPEVGGALVGGASLNAPDFLAIARAAATAQS
jgi:triosephosphate isomerase